MKRIGITGTIASGKTTVSILLKRRGLAVFNSDNYAKLALHRGNPCQEKIIAIVGSDVLDENGDIVPARMAKIIFHDEEKRLAVDAVIHPYVREGMRRFFERHDEDLAACAEVPLLFEAGWEDDFDQIILVVCDKETAVQRMMEDRDYSREEALARYDSQIDPEIQKAKADIVLDNSSDLKALDQKINQWMRELRKEARSGSKNT